MKWPWSRPATVRARSSFPFADLLTEARCRDLEILVRWLAAPYGDNMPVFATELPDVFMRRSSARHSRPRVVPGISARRVRTGRSGPIFCLIRHPKILDDHTAAGIR